MKRMTPKLAHFGWGIFQDTGYPPSKYLVNATKGTIAGILLMPLLREAMGVNLNPQEPARSIFFLERSILYCR